MNTSDKLEYDKSRIINNYYFIESSLLGKGSFGSVYPVIHIPTKTYCAAKKLSKKMIAERNLVEQMRNEMTIHKRIEHKNIVAYYDQFCTNDDIFIILEKCNSETLEKICESYKKLFNRNFSLRVTQYLLRQIVSAISYMHSKGIVHRDLKLENIMLKFPEEKPVENNKGYFYYNEEFVKSWESFEEVLMTSTVKIIDLGFAKQLDKSGLTSSFLGTPAFVAPEILKKKAPEGQFSDFRYSSKVDSWSIGIIAFLFLSGRFPFDLNNNVRNFQDLFNLHQEGKYYLDNDLYVSLELLDFINGMLQLSEIKRFSCVELFQHQFITKELEEQKTLYVRQINQNLKPLQLTTKERKEFITTFNSFTNFREDDSFFEGDLFKSRLNEFLKNDDEIDRIFGVFTKVTLEIETSVNDIDYVVVSLKSEEVKNDL